MKLAAIKGFRLVTSSAGRLVPFYQALGFTAGNPVTIDKNEMALLGLKGGGQRTPLLLGDSRLDLDQFDVPGRAYPADADAADLIFQHLALVASDVRAAWDAIRPAGALPISRDGPVTLPPSAGGVTAIKFRDPDGHPLELLQFPAGSNASWRGEGLLGIDHSAISVASDAASLAFYADLGLRVGNRTLNHGPSQGELDGLNDPVVDVVPMSPAHQTPHVELLRYRTPAGRARPPLALNDTAATRIVWAASEEGLLRDLDGHIHHLIR